MLAMAWALAQAGPYDTTEQVILAQPTAVVVSWRPELAPAVDEAPPAGVCLISLTAEDKGLAVFNTDGCDPAIRPAVVRALRGAKARPVEELGWGLKTWTQVRVQLTSTPTGTVVRLLPGGSSLVPELHASEITVRERLEPIYPADEKWRRATGTCHVWVHVDAKGRPTQVEPLLCTEGFAANSVSAIQSWRFKPHRVEGEPVVFDTVLTLDYSLQTPPQSEDSTP
jgi:hypothetical protein